MNQLRALISESPEELPQAFFKALKSNSSDHKVKVWSRKNSLPLDYDLYFLSYRDFTYLKKLKQLPLPHKVAVLATTASLNLSFKDSNLQQMCCYIIGSEESRGTLAAKYFLHLCQLKDGLIGSQIKESNSLEAISGIECADWLKNIVRNTLFEILSIDEAKMSRFVLEDRQDEVKITVECKIDFPSLELFSRCFTEATPTQLDLESLKILTLKTLLHSVTETIIYPGKNGVTLFDLSFFKFKTQRKYEQAPKLFGINLIKALNVSK